MPRPPRSNPKTRTHAIELRKEPTPAERKLWALIRNDQLGVNFRRQHAIGKYIPDFVCIEKRLIVELDGSQHLEQQEYDQERTKYLNLLTEAQALSETPLLTNQVPYSIPDRRYVENGVLAHCQSNDILLTAYSPVKSRFFKGKKLAEFAHQKSSTPFQVGLAWLARQPRVIAIPTSFNPQHQAENLSATELELSQAEMDFLDSLA